MFAVARVIANRVGKLALMAVLFVLSPPAVCAPAEFSDAAVIGGKASLTLTTAFLAATEDKGRLLRVYMVAVVPQAGGDALFARTPREWVRIEFFPIPELLSPSPRVVSHGAFMTRGSRRFTGRRESPRPC